MIDDNIIISHFDVQNKLNKNIISLIESLQRQVKLLQEQVQLTNTSQKESI